MNKKFEVFDVFEPGTSGGELAKGAAMPSPRAIALRLIEAVEPHPFAMNVSHLILTGGRRGVYVRGTLAGITNQLNKGASSEPRYK